jgi:hypothetical protein
VLSSYVVGDERWLPTLTIRTLDDRITVPQVPEVLWNTSLGGALGLLATSLHLRSHLDPVHPAETDSTKSENGQKKRPSTEIYYKNAAIRADLNWVSTDQHKQH